MEKLLESLSSTNVSDWTYTFKPKAYEYKDVVFYTFLQNIIILSKRVRICFINFRITIININFKYVFEYQYQLKY